MKLLALLLIGAIFLFSSCNFKTSENSEVKGANDQAQTSKTKSKKKKKEMLPTSAGSEYEVFVVGESNVINNPSIVKAIDSVLRQYVPAIPQLEQLYIPTFINVIDFRTLMQKNTKIMFLSLHQDNTISFLQENIKDLLDANPLKITSDVWSNPQICLHVNAQNIEELVKSIYHKETQIIHSLDKNTKRKLENLIYANAPISNESKLLTKEHKIDINLPSAYDLLLEAKPGKSDTILEQYNINGLTWYRSETQKSNNNILIYYFDYNEEILKDVNKLFDIKNKMGHLVQTEKKGSYMFIDTVNFYYYFEKVKLNGHEAIELRGLWKMENDWGGGPYINYIIPDKKNNRIVYIDAFIYAPGSKKKSFIKRLEVVLGTTRLL